MHRFTRRFFSSAGGGPVTVAYLSKVEAGALRRDAAQVALAGKLDSLHDALTVLPPISTDLLGGDPITRSIASAKSTFLSLVQPPPQGLYIYGSVGVGKSFLVDLFFETLDDSTAIKRVHFHDFMLHVHKRIFELKRAHPRQDVLPLVAFELVSNTGGRVLCFDEFQVTDIADAMILQRLFDILFDVGVVVVATSNRPPDDLFKGGINRSLFLPFIDTLKKRCDVVSVDTIHDYRSDTIESGASYFVASDENDHARQALEKIFRSDDINNLEKVILPVMFGRSVTVDRAHGACAWFNFRELCHQPLGAADYISISDRFSTLIVDAVPQLGAQYYNEARRFVTLIDACYESRTRLVIVAEVPLSKLFVDFDAAVESADGDEELTTTAQQPHLLSESWVSGSGGSSSSNATTMIRTEDGEDMEWSATGRIGVSLAQLSAVNDVSFSFKRAASRLMEMSGHAWGRQQEG